MMIKPLVALTLGDPAGVGPEVIAGVWPDSAIHQVCRPLVVGHPDVLARAVKLRGVRVRLEEIDDPRQARSTPERMCVLPAGSDDAAHVLPAVASAAGGQAAYDALLLAAELALAGRVDAITTAPLNKAALWKAGHRYPGHTELLAEKCGVRDFAMMLYLGPDERIRGPAGLGVVHVTLHMALADVFSNLSREAIVAKIGLANKIMGQLKGGEPRIGVCALNPHAGEEGLFGSEEQTTIAPAVDEARRAGIDVEGPLPADTLLVRAADGQFDGVVAMYHDQGHIALKLLGMHRAVNITLGLPIVRTSVAHGTAFDLAWQGRAETSSMVEAVRVAAVLARQRAAS